MKIPDLINVKQGTLSSIDEYSLYVWGETKEDDDIEFEFSSKEFHEIICKFFDKQSHSKNHMDYCKQVQVKEIFFNEEKGIYQWKMNSEIFYENGTFSNDTFYQDLTKEEIKELRKILGVPFLLNELRKDFIVTKDISLLEWIHDMNFDNKIFKDLSVLIKKVRTGKLYLLENSLFRFKWERNSYHNESKKIKEYPNAEIKKLVNDFIVLQGHSIEQLDYEGYHRFVINFTEGQLLINLENKDFLLSKEKVIQ